MEIVIVVYGDSDSRINSGREEAVLSDVLHKRVKDHEVGEACSTREVRNTHRVCIGIYEDMRLTERPGYRWGYNCKMYLNEIGCCC
jgi:hypothetical protein